MPCMYAEDIQKRYDFVPVAPPGKLWLAILYKHPLSQPDRAILEAIEEEMGADTDTAGLPLSPVSFTTTASPSSFGNIDGNFRSEALCRAIFMRNLPTRITREPKDNGVMAKNLERRARPRNKFEACRVGPGLTKRTASARSVDHLRSVGTTVVHFPTAVEAAKSEAKRRVSKRIGKTQVPAHFVTSWG